MALINNKYLLLVLFLCCYLLPLEFRYLWQPDESRYAEISREMLVSGNWIVPHFFDLRYFEKPIAGYWINNLSQLIFGHSNFAVRFGSVFSTAISALLVYWLALRLWCDRATALMAGVIFLSSLLVYGVGSYAVLDPMIALWLTAAMCSYWLAAEAENRRGKLRGWVLLGLACGMGFMTKGFLALAIPVIAILPWAIHQRRLRELLIYGPVAMLCALLISAPWAIAIARQEPDFWHYFFWVEHIQRFAESNAQHKAPFWYYLPVLLAGSLPWLALLPGALRAGWQDRKQSSGSLYLLCWVVMPLLFFSIAKGKLPTYILPCFAPLAILLARYAQRQMQGTERILAWNGKINLVFGGVCCAVVLGVLAPWGVAKQPVYQPGETGKVLLAAAAFLCWALCGLVTLRAPHQRWSWAAFCPLLLALVVGAVIPAKVIDSKQPQAFIQRISLQISGSRWLLSDDPGIASSVAWQLRRSDILLYDQQGEMRYGLSYPDARGKFVSRAAFAGWLQQHRRSGSVSLVLLLSGPDEQALTNLPPPDFSERQGKLLLVQYRQQP